MPYTVTLNANYTDDLLQRLRSHGISIGALARKSSIDRSRMSRLFNTPVQPGWKSIIRLETAFRELIAGQEGEMSPVESKDAGDVR